MGWLQGTATSHNNNHPPPGRARGVPLFFVFCFLTGHTIDDHNNTFSLNADILEPSYYSSANHSEDIKRSKRAVEHRQSKMLLTAGEKKGTEHLYPF